MTNAKEHGKKNFYPDDSKRPFIKIGIDVEQPELVELRDGFAHIDQTIGSDEVKYALFGKRRVQKKPENYRYIPCVKIPEFEDDGVTGLLVPVKDADGMESALRLLLNDPARRHTMGAAAAQQARDRFDQQHQIDLTLDTYRRLLPERAPS